MAMKLAFALLLVVPALTLKVDSLDDAPGKGNAVAKVVKLLKEMQAQIEKEAAEDAAMYDQLACWCETNKREKTKAIEDAQARISDLNAAVPMYAAKASQLEVDIKHHQKEVAEKTNALEEATEIRAKEQGEFRSNEKDMISSLTSLKGAVRSLGAVASGAALPQESLMQVQNLLEKHQHILRHAISSHDRRAALSLLQGPSSLLQQHLKGKRAAIPMAGKGTQSGVIFGILKQMKEEFETNLASSQKEEEEAVATFAALKKAKTEEVAAGEGLIETKTVQLAEAKEKKAVSKEDLEDTRVMLKSDNEFLSNVNLKCQGADKQYEDRVKVRNEELAAVSEATAILTDDDSKDQFNKSEFLQISSRSTRSSNRDRAADLLKKVALKVHKPKLMTLAMKMRLSGFDEVKEEIDKVVAALKEEQKTEVEQKDYCIAEFNENDMQTAEKTDQKGDLEQKINDLSTTMDELTEAIATVKGEVADTQTEMKKASQLREKENNDFQITVNDQRASAAILQKAVDRLKAFYEKKAAALLQAGQEPPAQATYKKNAGAAGIMTMIETLIEECQELEKEAMKSETEAQSAYETFMKDSTATVEAGEKDITNKSQELAKADGAKVQAENDLKGTIDQLLTLGEYSQELHKQCDFLVKNFDLRQSSRVQEMEALNQAKAIFSGAF